MDHESAQQPGGAPAGAAGTGPDIEAVIRATGAEYETGTVERDDVDEHASALNQALHLRVNADTVSTYVWDHQKGDVFPRLVLRARPPRTPGGRTTYQVLDGNHRLAMYKVVGVHDIPALVVTCTDAQALLITFAANRKNGLQLTRAEILGHAMTLHRAGASPSAVCQATGVPVAALNQKIALDKAEALATQYGVDWAHLGAGVRSALAVPLFTLAFRYAATLAVAASLSIDETKNVVTSLKPTADENDVAKVAAVWDDVYGPRIADTVGGTFKTSRRDPRRRMHDSLSTIARILDFEHPENPRRSAAARTTASTWSVASATPWPSSTRPAKRLGG